MAMFNLSDFLAMTRTEARADLLKGQLNAFTHQKFPCVNCSKILFCNYDQTTSMTHELGFFPKVLNKCKRYPMGK
jgi:hypothetical protein